MKWSRAVRVGWGGGGSLGTDLGGYRNPPLLDALFVQHSMSTHFIEVEDGADCRTLSGEDKNMQVCANEYLGVRAGDILTVDRSLTPAVGNLVLAMRGRACTLCRYTEHEGRRFLVCGQACASDISDEGTNMRVWGVVSALSRRL